MSAREVVVRLDPGLADTVLAEAGSTALEEFVERAVIHELDRARLSRFLDEMDAEFGPVDERLVERFDAMFDEVEEARGSRGSR